MFFFRVYLYRGILALEYSFFFFFFSSRRRHTRYIGDWSSDVCSSDLDEPGRQQQQQPRGGHCALYGVDLRIDDDQSRGYADHGKPGGAVLDGDVQLRLDRKSVV